MSARERWVSGAIKVNSWLGRMGIAVLMNESIWICVKETRRLNSRIIYQILYIIREFGSVIYHQDWRKQRVSKGYKFWEKLKWYIEAYNNKWRVVVIGDMNDRVRDSEVEDVLFEFGV